MIKLLIVLTVFCAVIAKVKSDYNRPHGPYNARYKRIRYNGPPHKFYNRPPSHGFISHKVPSHVDDGLSSHSGSYKNGPKVFKRPSENLEEDLQRFIKQLSSQDLDKIVEIAGQNRDSERYNKDHHEKHNKYQPDEYNTVNNTVYSDFPSKTQDDNHIHNSNVQVIDLDPFSQNQPNEDYINEINYMTEPAPIYSETDLYKNEYNAEYNAPTNAQDNIQSYSGIENDEVLFSGIQEMPEVDLASPVNLREDDFEVADTKNSPAVALPSYQVEDFGNLPLMNYHSKKDTLSSYHVPHYTVTSKSTYSAPPASSYTPSYKPGYGVNIPVEPAPPVSAAKYQSDANQKAVKIWATRSKGWAYTLHDDGSLSLEKYGPKYG